jgi:hypothetical protein
MRSRDFPQKQARIIDPRPPPGKQTDQATMPRLLLHPGGVAARSRGLSVLAIPPVNKKENASCTRPRNATKPVTPHPRFPILHRIHPPKRAINPTPQIPILFIHPHILFILFKNPPLTHPQASPLSANTSSPPNPTSHALTPTACLIPNISLKNNPPNTPPPQLSSNTSPRNHPHYHLIPRQSPLLLTPHRLMQLHRRLRRRPSRRIITTPKIKQKTQSMRHAHP